MAKFSDLTKTCTADSAAELGSLNKKPTVIRTSLYENKNYISAKDARQVANTTRCLLNHLYKTITEAAKEGVLSISWDITNVSDVLLEHVVEELTAAGYSIVIRDCPSDNLTPGTTGELVISW